MNIRIFIVSGEGNEGTRQRYLGRMTARAIRARLTRESAGGDRWARVQIEDSCGPRESTPEEVAAIFGEAGLP